jgi:hypothetical protein
MWVTPHLDRYPAFSTCEHLANHSCFPPTSTTLFSARVLHACYCAQVCLTMHLPQSIKGVQLGTLPPTPNADVDTFHLI